MLLILIMMDGWMDAVVSTSQNKCDVVYRNNHNGTFAVINLPGTTTAFGVKCGDLDNDGKVDIVVSNSSGAQNVIYKNNGNFSFTKTNVSNVATSTTDVDICDLNNDGLKDLVFSTATGTGSADIIAWNMGNLQFVYAFLPSVSLADTIVCADVDGDYDQDIVVGCRGGAYIYENVGGLFSQIILDSTLSINGMAKGQLDSIPGEEVIGATYNADSYDVIVRKTGSPYTKFQVTPFQVQAGLIGRDSVAIGDLDLDGDNDAYMSVHQGNDFLYLNVSSTQLDFVRVSIPSTSEDKNGVALADFDNDGDLDAFITTRAVGGAYDLVSWNTTLVKGQDTDLDGMPDIYEIKTGLNKDINDALLDPDSDGMSNYSEFVSGTNPKVYDASTIRLMINSATGIICFEASAVTGVQYVGMKRFFTIEHTAELSGNWTPMSGFQNIEGQNQTVIAPISLIGQYSRIKATISY